MTKCFALVFLSILIFSGCVASKIEKYDEYTPRSSRYPNLEPNAIDEYYFISWEPYHFIFTLGLLPQYGYVVYKDSDGKYEKQSTMIGWCAIPLPLMSSWRYGNISKEERKKYTQQQL